MKTHFVKLFTTFFYIGYFPKAPGSVASIAGVALYCLLHAHLSVYVGILVAITIIGFLTSGEMERILNQKDPSCVVIDEVAGMMVALVMLPAIPLVVISAYALFRFFDIFKTYPINKLEALEGGTGIMLDDLMAGFYTNVLMHIAVKLVGIL